MTLFRLYIIGLFLFPSLTFSQSKKELESKVQQQEKSIDSLKKAIANFENIIENRDRSIKIMRVDMEKYKEIIREKNEVIGQQRNQIAVLKAQQATGSAKILALSNSRSKLKVSPGMVWTINQFITDYTSEFTTDSLGNKHPEEIHVFLKSINGEQLTDITNNQFGPKVFSSLHPEQVIPFPIILTENTSFSIAVYSGTIDALIPYDGNVFFSYTEKQL
ncbi:MAG: hypothetical protein WDZ35_10340 [Crocinitomicaceae bacterium]